MSRQPYEVLNNALKQVEGAMGLDKLPRMAIPVQPKRQERLLQVELLVLFHPSMQDGHHHVKAMPTNCAQGFMTVDVFGRITTDEHSGLPVLEDTRFEVKGEDIEALLPESLVNEIARYVANN